MDQPGKAANPARGQLNSRENEYFPVPVCLPGDDSTTTMILITSSNIYYVLETTRWRFMEAEVWVENVMEGERRFMAACRKEEVDAARHRQEKRERRVLQSDTHWPSRRVEGISVRTRDQPRPA